MKLILLAEGRVAYLGCPQCNAKGVMCVSGNKAACPSCNFEFAVDTNTAANFTADGFEPPYTQFSARYGGPLAGKKDGALLTRSNKVGETIRP